MKRGVPIDQLLAWAFRDGLPRESLVMEVSSLGTEAWHLGTRVDGGTYYEPRLIDEAHPDAKVIQTAVVGLQQTTAQLNWGEQGEFILGPLADRLTQTEILNHGGRRADSGWLVDGPTVNVGSLVFQHAMNRTYPRWNFGEQLIPMQVKKGTPPRWRLVCDNGHGRMEDISPVEIARARHEYHVWWEALLRLPDTLPVLTQFTAMEPIAPYAPWRDSLRLNGYDGVING